MFITIEICLLYRSVLSGDIGTAVIVNNRNMLLEIYIYCYFILVVSFNDI